MIGFLSLIADVSFWVLLFFAKEEVDPRWRGILAVGWFGLWALSRFFPGTSYAVMAVVAIIDIGLLYAILGEYAAKA